MKEIVKLGQLLGSAEQRDAVHVAVMPCWSFGELLQPGQHVRLVSGEAGKWFASSALPHVGIVDPFLPHSVGIGQRFYVLLYPNTIESLRHEWRHKLIDGDAK